MVKDIQRLILLALTMWCVYVVLIVLVVLFILSGCTSLHVGVGVHPESLDQPEINLDNPIGLIGGEAEISNNVVGFFDHYSGLFEREYGYGFNVVGVKAKVDLTNR